MVMKVMKSMGKLRSRLTTGSYEHQLLRDIRLQPCHTHQDDLDQNQMQGSTAAQHTPFDWAVPV